MKDRKSNTGAVFAQAAFYRAQQDAQHGTLQCGVALQEVAQAFGHGEYPLMELLAIRLSEQTTLAKSLVMPHWQPWKDVIGQMCGGFGHAPCVA
jgi:hypothetical protein